MNKVSQITRRNIFDSLKIEKAYWYGRLGDIGFLNRLYDLNQMPSNDSRFKNASGDIWQHRENNYDWDDFWVFEDSRFNLLNCEDGKFLEFLCETIHPIV